MSNKTKIIGIYKIINRINNKIYIGQSVDVNYRLYIHKRNIKKNKRHPLYDSMRKYGIENFEFIIMEQLHDVSKLDEREQYWINHYKSNDLTYGYNLRLECTTNRGCKYSKESRKRFSERQKRLCQNPDYIKNLSDKNKERWKDVEFRKNYSEKMRIKNKDPKRKEQNSERGKKLWQDPIHRNKMLEARKHSEEKRLATVESKKLADSEYTSAILEKRKQTRITKGITKIYFINKDKVKCLYLDENYRLKDVARIMNISYGLLSKFVKINNLQKPTNLARKVKSIITDEQLHNLCDSVYSQV